MRNYDQDGVEDATASARVVAAPVGVVVGERMVLVLRVLARLSTGVTVRPIVMSPRIAVCGATLRPNEAPHRETRTAKLI